ncbi:hypothetical protein D3C76_1490020 [compost metagenome]
MPHRVSGFGVFPMSRASEAIELESLPIQALPFGLVPPTAAKVLLVKLEISSAMDTSSRSSMSRDQVTEASGPCRV